MVPRYPKPSDPESGASHPRAREPVEQEHLRTPEVATILEEIERITDVCEAACGGLRDRDDFVLDLLRGATAEVIANAEDPRGGAWDRLKQIFPSDKEHAVYARLMERFAGVLQEIGANNQRAVFVPEEPLRDIGLMRPPSAKEIASGRDAQWVVLASLRVAQSRIKKAQKLLWILSAKFGAEGDDKISFDDLRGATRLLAGYLLQLLRAYSAFLAVVEEEKKSAREAHPASTPQRSQEPQIQEEDVLQSLRNWILDAQRAVASLLRIADLPDGDPNAQGLAREFAAAYAGYQAGRWRGPFLLGSGSAELNVAKALGTGAVLGAGVLGAIHNITVSPGTHMQEASSSSTTQNVAAQEVPHRTGEEALQAARQHLLRDPRTGEMVALGDIAGQYGWDEAFLERVGADQRLLDQTAAIVAALLQDGKAPTEDVVGGILRSLSSAAESSAGSQWYVG